MNAQNDARNDSSSENGELLNYENDEDMNEECDHCHCDIVCGLLDDYDCEAQ